MKLRSGQFYGQTTKNVKISGMTLTESVYQSRLFLPAHVHQNAYFCFIIEGGYTEKYLGRTRDCAPSMVVFHPEGEEHADKFHDSGGRCLSLELGSDTLSRLREQSVFLADPADFRGGHLTQLGAKLYREFRLMDAFSLLAMEGLALEVYAEASRHRAPVEQQPPRWLEQARELLHYHRGTCVRLERVAAEVGVHPVHLSRTFRRFYQCSASDYLRRLRVELAQKKLSTTNISIGEIALEAGFSDQSHFTRAFRIVTGLTPAAFRASSWAVKSRPPR